MKILHNIKTCNYMQMFAGLKSEFKMFFFYIIFVDIIYFFSADIIKIKTQ